MSKLARLALDISGGGFRICRESGGETDVEITILHFNEILKERREGYNEKAVVASYSFGWSVHGIPGSFTAEIDIGGVPGVDPEILYTGFPIYTSETGKVTQLTKGRWLFIDNETYLLHREDKNFEFTYISVIPEVDVYKDLLRSLAQPKRALLILPDARGFSLLRLFGKGEKKPKPKDAAPTPVLYEAEQWMEDGHSLASGAWRMEGIPGHFLTRYRLSPRTGFWEHVVTSHCSANGKRYSNLSATPGTYLIGDTYLFRMGKLPGPMGQALFNDQFHRPSEFDILDKIMDDRKGGK